MADAIGKDSRPKIASKARLRFDRKTGRYMLLYPEKGLELNPTAADAVKLCTGEHSVAAIVGQLAAKYGRDAQSIESEVTGFLAALAERGLLERSS